MQAAMCAVQYIGKASTVARRRTTERNVKTLLICMHGKGKSAIGIECTSCLGRYKRHFKVTVWQKVDILQSTLNLKDPKKSSINVSTHDT